MPYAVDYISLRRALEEKLTPKVNPEKSALQSLFMNVVITGMLIALIVGFYSLPPESIFIVGAVGWYGLAIIFLILLIMFWMLETFGTLSRWLDMRKAHNANKLVIRIDGITYTNKEMPTDIKQKLIDQINQNTSAPNI